MNENIRQSIPKFDVWASEAFANFVKFVDQSLPLPLSRLTPRIIFRFGFIAGYHLAMNEAANKAKFDRMLTLAMISEESTPLRDSVMAFGSVFEGVDL